jgi:2-polyprenyl-3-methyl-5-hydroxy-6-metoxy-1,4-benzoquinol methylase
MNTKKTTHHNITKIRDTLIRIGAIREANIELFSNKTRDNDKLNVYIDNVSNVIFIDDFYVGDDEYMSGSYRLNSLDKDRSNKINYQDMIDNTRRLSTYQSLLSGKTICDYGCGAGHFIKLSKSIVKSVCGVEIQENFVKELKKCGINCYTSINEIDKKFDAITLFHSLEHLPDPIKTLRLLYEKLTIDGKGILIVEVPNARDFLINQIKSAEFIDFTLWSQHLILHTRESLRLILNDAGFKNISIQGVQRYGLANHLNWLSKKLPSGNTSTLSFIETPELKSSYESALSRIDATDTLVAIATT